MKRAFLVCVLLVACGDDDGGVDASTDAMSDVGLDDGGLDAAIDGGDDAGRDAATDAATDGGSDGGADASVDASTDAGLDAGMGDGIGEVRAAAAGSHLPSLPVRDVIVTYVRDAIGDDPAGFFVQVAATGPALFVDDETASPAPAVGDRVSFDVTETEMVSGMLHVTGIADYTRVGTGADVAALVQTLSAATDLVTNYTEYESELVEIRGTIDAIPIVGGTAHVVAPFVTAGMDDMNFLFRIPQSVAIDNELREGCTLTATAPLWRFVDSIQVHPLVSADLSAVSCPALPGTEPNAGELVITEVFFDDGVVGMDGPFEWVELFNPTDTALQLYGCELDDDPAGGGTPRAIVQSVVVDPGEYVVFGGDMSETSPVGPFGPALNNGGDTVVVRCTTLIDQVSYTTGVPGSSVQLDPRSTTAALNDDPSNWCASTSPYGTSGFFGTPNVDNPTCSTIAELMITEYVEGSSQNKAVEISNVGGASFADLSACTLNLYSNGAATPTNTFAYPAVALTPGATFVVCNTGAEAALMASCDATDSVTFFNGNDALVLDCGATVDVIGQVGFDPGSAWSAGGVSTQNQTIRRACTARGDVDESDAFDPSLGWASFSIDTFSDVGTAPSCP